MGAGGKVLGSRTSGTATHGDEQRARSKHVDIHRYQVEIRRNVVLIEEAIEAGP